MPPKLIYKKSHCNCVGLSANQSYRLELLCLQRLAKNFECKCGLGRDHFPRVRVCRRRTLGMTHCGCSLDIPLSRRSTVPPLQDLKLDAQIDCIVDNLVRCNIEHLDPLDKNLCLSDDGVLSLIDFDIASVDNHPLTHQIRHRMDSMRCAGSDYASTIRSTIKMIIEAWYESVVYQSPLARCWELTDSFA